MHEIVTGVDPALQVMAYEGTKRYREVYELVHRREASKPNYADKPAETEIDWPPAS